MASILRFRPQVSFEHLGHDPPPDTGLRVGAGTADPLILDVYVEKRRARAIEGTAGYALGSVVVGDTGRVMGRSDGPDVDGARSFHPDCRVGTKWTRPMVFGCVSEAITTRLAGQLPFSGYTRLMVAARTRGRQIVDSRRNE